MSKELQYSVIHKGWNFNADLKISVDNDDLKISIDNDDLKISIDNDDLKIS